MCWREISPSASTSSWQVEELIYPSDYRKIMLFFRKNPYFQNEVVVKEYLIEVTGK